MLSSPACSSFRLPPTRGGARRRSAAAGTNTMRDRSKNRKPMQRGRYLSTEATQVVQLRIAPAQAFPRPPAPARRFACHACAMFAALLVLLAVPVTALWLLAAAAAWWSVNYSRWRNRGTMDSLPRTNV